MPENVAPAVEDGKANCPADCATNDPRTETLRRALQSSLTYGSEAFLARRSGVCMGSTAKQIEGSQRLSAPLLRAALLLHSPDEIAELLSLWLGVPLRHEP
jgi:hypothetical protein